MIRPLSLNRSSASKPMAPPEPDKGRFASIALHVAVRRLFFARRSRPGHHRHPPLGRHRHTWVSSIDYGYDDAGPHHLEQPRRHCRDHLHDGRNVGRVTF